MAMRQISVKLTEKERDSVDVLINRGMFASYGHAFRGMLYYYKTTKRTNARLLAENAVMRAKIAELKEHADLVEQK